MASESAEAKPRVRRVRIGMLSVESGVLWFIDPMLWSRPVAIRGVPRGRFPVRARVIRLPSGGRWVASVAVEFEPGRPDARRKVGEVAVDSAKVVAIDAAARRALAAPAGPDRVGYVEVPDLKLVRRIVKRFGLTPRKAGPFETAFLEPITPELEARILADLKTIPEYASATCLYFRVWTGTAWDRIEAAMRPPLVAGAGRPWAEVTLGDTIGSRLLVFKSGYGDGSYPVFRLYRDGRFVGAEVTFIDLD